MIQEKKRGGGIFPVTVKDIVFEGDWIFATSFFLTQKQDPVHTSPLATEENKEKGEDKTRIF